jgi:hypothetical protein
MLMSSSNVIPFPRPATAPPRPPSAPSVERRDPAAVLPLAIDELRDALAAAVSHPRATSTLRALAPTGG